MNDAEVLVLCGGLGTRLSSISKGVPKGLMLGPSGFPFIYELIDQLSRSGFNNIILALGYGSEEYVDFFRTQFHKDVSIRFSIENSPLGTGGAIINAIKEINTETFFVVNGDTHTTINYTEMFKFHKQKNAQVTISGLELQKSRSDVGSIKYDAITYALVEFSEKNNSSKCVNAGVYIFNKEIFLSKNYEAKKLSLEKEIIPEFINSKARIYLYKFSGEMSDIGTPERYKRYVEPK